MIVAEDLLALALGPLVGGDHDRAGAVVDARRVAGRVRALLAARGPAAWPAPRAPESRRGRLVDLDDRVALPALDRHGDDLLGQAAVVGRGDRALVRAQRPACPGRRGSSPARSPTSVASSNICLPLNGLARPSWTIASSALHVAHPEAEARASGSRYGACDIDSMPPPTPTSMSPARIAWSSIPTARMPDAQTLLIVSEETSFGIPALICAWRDGICPCARLEHLAHHDVLDLLGRHVGALQRGLDGDAAELGGVQGRQAAAELADGRAGGAKDHGAWHTNGESDPKVRAVMRVSSTTAGAAGDWRRHDRHRGLRGQGDRARRRRRAAGDSSTPARRKGGLRKLAVTHAGGRRYILVGLGKRDDFDAEGARLAAAAVVGRAKELGTRVLCWELPHHIRGAAASSRARCWRPTSTTPTSRSPRTRAASRS